MAVMTTKIGASSSTYKVAIIYKDSCPKKRDGNKYFTEITEKLLLKLSKQEIEGGYDAIKFHKFGYKNCAISFGDGGRITVKSKDKFDHNEDYYKMTIS